MKDFQRALITGASSGIGESLARLLADKSIHLILSGRNAQHLEELQKELSAKVKVDVVPGDLAIAADREVLLSKIQELRPDLLINNAGLGLYGDLITFPAEEQLQIIDVNIKALVELSMAVAKTLYDESKPGVIMNVSSSAAFLTFPGFTVYSASKSFVNEFSKSFDAEMKEFGIRVLASCPGQIDTQFRMRASHGAASSSEGFSVMTSSYAAQQIWKQIVKEKRVHIFNWKYRMTILLTKLIPDSWLTPLLRHSIANVAPIEHFLHKKE